MYKIAVFCVLGFVMPVSAIVVADYTAAEAAPSGLGYDLNWDYVYSYNGATAVAVTNDWIVTAKHVGLATSFSVDGVSYTSLERVAHPTADIALIRVDKALPGYYELYTDSLAAIDTNVVLVVGYGTTGTVASISWTATGAGSGVKRWGTQQIDGSNISNKTFTMTFNTNDTPYEAGTGHGDSGSGVFFEEGGTYKLAGINTRNISGGWGYESIGGVSMPAVADWVIATIPEPAAMGLTGVGTIGLFLARSRRRRKWAGRSVFPIRGDEPLCDRFDDTETAGETLDGAGICAAVAIGLKRVGTSLVAVWMNYVYVRYKAVSKAFLSLFIAVANHVAAGIAAGRMRFNTAVTRSLDAFLEGISWERITTSVQSARIQSQSVLKKGICKRLDVFLEILPWDQMVAAYSRFKRFIRFYH